MSQRTDAWNSAEQNSAEYMHWVFRRLSYLAEGKPIEQIQTLILLIIEDTKRWEHNADLIANIPLKNNFFFIKRQRILKKLVEIKKTKNKSQK